MRRSALLAMLMIVVASATIAAATVPEWAGKAYIEDGYRYQSGFGHQSSPEMSLNRAESEARNGLAFWMQSEIAEDVIEYGPEMTEGEKEAIMAALTSGYTVISGSETVDAVEMEDGGVWALVSMPVAAAYGWAYDVLYTELSELRDNAEPAPPSLPAPAGPRPHHHR